MESGSLDDLLGFELYNYAKEQKIKELSTVTKVPKRLRDLPAIFLSLVTAPSTFFKNSKDVPYSLGVVFALLCLTPFLAIKNYHYLLNAPDLIKDLGSVEIIISSIVAGVFQAAIFAFVADIILFFSFRVFSSQQANFASLSKILHFSLTPFLLYILPYTFLFYIAVGISLAFLSNALRSTYQCSNLQSFLTLIPFFILLFFLPVT